MFEVAEPMARVKRLLIVIAAFVVVVVALAIVLLLFYIVTAIAFSGSTGNAHRSFLESLAPVFRFVIGAVATGGLVGLVNALVATRGVWALPLAGISIVGGLVAMANPEVANTLAELAFPAYTIAGKIVLPR
jgi:hypothetical protein